MPDDLPSDDAGIGTLTCIEVTAGTFEIVGRGLWSHRYIDAHFTALETRLAGARAIHGGVRVLVDLREAMVQPGETADRIAYWTGRIYRAEDRVAILVASVLLKTQMRRISVIAARELFLSETAARTWLSA